MFTFFSLTYGDIRDGNISLKGGCDCDFFFKKLSLSEKLIKTFL